MRLFTLIDLHHLILALFLGLAAALTIYLAFRYGPFGKNAQDENEEGSQEYFDEETTAQRRPVPPVLLFVYIGAAFSIIFYVIFSILRGPL